MFNAKGLSHHGTFILSLVRQHGAMDDVTDGLSTDAHRNISDSSIKVMAVLAATKRQRCLALKS